MNGLSKYYIRKIINCFSDEMTATATSQKLRINRNTVNKYYRIIREAVADYQESLNHYGAQADNHILSWHRHKGLSLDGGEGSILFQLTEKDGKVFIERYTGEAVPPMPTQDERSEMSTANNMDTWSGSGAAANGTSASSSSSSRQKNDEQTHMLTTSNTVKSFFNYAREKLAKFYGVKPEYTYLYLKELEFRFNNRNKDLSKIIWRILPHHSRKLY